MDLFDDAQRREDAAPFERLAHKALAAYGLEDARLDLASRGEHVVFRVFDRPTRSAYALRIHPRGRAREQILRTLLWLASLHRETDALVPEPVLTRSGDLTQSLSAPGVSGFRQVSLAAWLDGQIRPFGEWTSEDAERLGRAVGSLHRHASTFRLPDRLAPDRREPAARLDEIDPDRLSHVLGPEGKALLSRAVSVARDAMAEVESDATVAGLIHGNPTPEHVLFDEEKVGLVGFGECHWGLFADDLAIADLSLRRCHDPGALRAGLFAGYAQVHTLPIDAEASLDAFVVLRLLDELNARAAGLDRSDPAARRGAEKILRQLARLIERAP